jgi:hypothetical protein
VPQVASEPVCSVFRNKPVVSGQTERISFSLGQNSGDLSDWRILCANFRR